MPRHHFSPENLDKARYFRDEMEIIARDMAILGLLYRRLHRNGGLTPEECSRGIPGGSNAT